MTAYNSDTWPSAAAIPVKFVGYWVVGQFKLKAVAEIA